MGRIPGEFSAGRFLGRDFPQKEFPWENTLNTDYNNPKLELLCQFVGMQHFINKAWLFSFVTKSGIEKVTNQRDFPL